MAVGRVTQQMLVQRSLDHMNAGSARSSRLQEQLTTGRTINRPSDNPTETSAAMRLRSAVAASEQHQLAAQDGADWLNTADSAMSSATDLVRRARELGIQSVNGSMSQVSRDALAASVTQLRESLVSVANTTYLDRPVFGGVAAGTKAYDADGDYAGRAGTVMRTVGDNVKVRVDVDGPATFGPDGDSVFTHLESLSAALTAGDNAAVSTALGRLQEDLDRIGRSRAEAGTRASTIDQALQVAADSELRLNTSLTEVENIDLPATIVQLRLQEVAYQAALGATARVLQPSLMDFLR